MIGWLRQEGLEMQPDPRGIFRVILKACKQALYSKLQFIVCKIRVERPFFYQKCCFPVKGEIRKFKRVINQ